jgi:hypothetical protein
MSPPSESPIRVGDRYRLDERIGAGAMGAVWRATDELLNRTVAVKELLAAAAPPTAAGGDALEESRQRILREGRIGARLQHAHVISMFDVVVYEDRPWLVMEYLPSLSLAQVLGEKGPLPPRQVADIGRQVADGLAAAHVAGVVHRDVKPGNVLIAEDGLVKLTDFGVSRAVDDVQLTRTGLIAGTPAFLSPEVARGQDPTAASDVFALGATLYAAVEGTPPFGLNENAYALLHKVAMGEVRPPEQDGPVMDVVMRLLSREPEKRPSATQARDALAAAAGREHGLTGASAPTTTATATATAVLGAAAAPRPAPATPTATEVRPVAAPPPPPPRKRNLRPLLIALAVVLLAGIGALAALLNGAGGNGGNQPIPPAGPASASAPAVPPAGAPTTTPAPSPTPSSTPRPTTSTAPTTAPSTTSGSAAPGSTESTAFVQRYYSLLPGNTDAAWQLLSPQAQQASGGRSGFDTFYGGLRSVSLQNVRSTGDNTVQATVVFMRNDGSSSSESYRFVTGTGADGQTIMESFSRT